MARGDFLSSFQAESCAKPLKKYFIQNFLYCQRETIMGFSRQEYWSGLPYPSPGDLPNPAESAVLSPVWTPLPAGSRSGWKWTESGQEGVCWPSPTPGSPAPAEGELSPAGTHRARPGASLPSASSESIQATPACSPNRGPQCLHHVPCGHSAGFPSTRVETLRVRTYHC